MRNVRARGVIGKGALANVPVGGPFFHAHTQLDVIHA
jgi:hypothetical protein